MEPLEEARAKRYAGWKRPEAKAMLSVSLDQAAQRVRDQGVNPVPKSGGQERLENLWNRFI